MKSDPKSARLLATVIATVQQAIGPSPRLAELSPCLEVLEDLAPERTFTHQLLARQALYIGDPREASRISESFVDRAPATRVDFDEISRVAREALGAAAQQGGDAGD